MNKKNFAAIGFHAGALILVFASLLPFLWMLSTSFKTRGALTALPIEWIPKEPTFESYVRLFGKNGFFGSMFNSLFVSAASVAVTLVSSAMAAFAFSKIEFRGRGALFMVFLATMMIPSQVLFIPLYLIMSELRLVDNLAALILPAVFRAFAVFMLRQQMAAVPAAYTEAPAIDGAGLWTIFIRVICPMCKTSFVTLAVICFMESWNDYLLPLVMLTSEEKFTLPIILNSLNGQYGAEYNLLMAGALLSMAPILLAYAFGQKYFERGLQIGGVKG